VSAKILEDTAINLHLVSLHPVNLKTWILSIANTTVTSTNAGADLTRRIHAYCSSKPRIHVV